MKYVCEKPVAKDVRTRGVKIRRKSQAVWRLSFGNFQKKWEIKPDVEQWDRRVSRFERSFEKKNEFGFIITKNTD